MAGAKVDIENAKVDIEDVEADIRNRLLSFSDMISEKTVNHALELFSKCGKKEYFGRTIVEDITGLKSTRASELIKLLVDSEVIVPVTGHGKIVVDGEDVDSPEYYIDLVTDKRTVSIPIDLRVGKEEPFLESTRGLQFTISLNFIN